MVTYFWLGNGPYSIAVYLPAVGRKLLSTVLLLSACSQLCGHISCEPFELHSPVTSYYVLYHGWAGSSKIPYDRCVDFKSVRMEYTLQMSDIDVPTRYEKALSSLGFCGRDVCDECSGFALYATDKLSFRGIKMEVESDNKSQSQCSEV